MRIQKYLSSKGVCSRREAEDFILRGLVTVNGKIVREMGVKIDPETDRVELNSAGAKDKKKAWLFISPKESFRRGFLPKVKRYTIFSRNFLN